MPYVALRRMTTTEGERLPGDEVPEAATWKNVAVYLRNGYIKEVPVIKKSRSRNLSKGKSGLSVKPAKKAKVASGDWKPKL